MRKRAKSTQLQSQWAHARFESTPGKINGCVSIIYRTINIKNAADVRRECTVLHQVTFPLAVRWVPFRKGLQDWTATALFQKFLLKTLYVPVTMFSHWRFLVYFSSPFLWHDESVPAWALERLNAVCLVTQVGLSMCPFTEIAEG